MLLVLEYKLVSMISEVSVELMKLQREVWSNNRKYWKNVKQYKEKTERTRESAARYIMSSNEVSIARGIMFLDDMETIFNGYKMGTNGVYDQLIEGQLDKILGIRTAIRLINHQPSIFEQFK